MRPTRSRTHTRTQMHESCLSPALQVRKLEVDGQRVRLQLWDTAGKERQNALSYKFYRGNAHTHAHTHTHTTYGVSLQVPQR